MTSENVDLVFEIGFRNKTRNPKTHFDDEKSFLEVRWISTKKSNSGFHGFPSVCSFGKSEKRFPTLLS